MATGYKFPILNSDGTTSGSKVDMEDMFVPKDQFLTAGLWSCGYNKYGQLGNGNTINYSSPIQVGSLTNWKLIKGMYVTISAIKTDGTLWGWGWNGYFGSLGNGTTISYSSPVQIGSLNNWKQVDNATHMTAVKTDGTLWTCGYNAWGQLGNGTRVYYSSPIQIGSLTNWKTISNGFYHTVAIKTDGTLWGWGNNIFGRLGNGTTIHYSSPVQIGALTNWKQVSGGYYHSAAIKTDGTLWTWGSGSAGQLGNSNSIEYSSPIQVGTASNWSQVACGYYHTLAIKTDGTLWACGYNNHGGLGNSNTINYSSPIQVGSLTSWKQVSGGAGSTTVAVKTDGTLWAWGRNNFGQLGNGTTINYSSPIQVGALTNWKQAFMTNYCLSAIQAPDYYYNQ